MHCTKHKPNEEGSRSCLCRLTWSDMPSHHRRQLSTYRIQTTMCTVVFTRHFLQLWITLHRQKHSVSHGNFGLSSQGKCNRNSVRHGRAIARSTGIQRVSNVKFGKSDKSECHIFKHAVRYYTKQSATQSIRRRQCSSRAIAIQSRLHTSWIFRIAHI